MTNTEDENFVTKHPEDNAIIPDSQLPIPSQGLPQRLAVFMRSCHEAGFNRPPDPFPDITIELRYILFLDVRMVNG